MKGVHIQSCLRLATGCFALTLAGCLSLPNSPMSPTPRFYMLSAISDAQVIKKINIKPGLIIGVGPVKIPEYLDRPQMVTKDSLGILKFDEFNRWGESLDLGIARVMREDLTLMLPGAKLTLYPYNPAMAVKYQVNLELVQLDSALDGDMLLVVQWVVVDVQNLKIMTIKRSEFRAPIIPPNDSGLAKTLSTMSASLSSQIAQTLGTQQIKEKASNKPL